MSRYSKYSGIKPFPPIGQRSVEPLSVGDKVLEFPEEIKLKLTYSQREGLRELADSVSHESDEELVRTVLWRGIEIMQHEINHGLTLDSPPEIPDASASARARSGKTAQAPTPHYHVENYLGFPIEERLRQRLEDALELLCPDALSEEEAYAMLLELGLKNFEGRPVADVIQNVKEAARLRRVHTKVVTGIRRG